MELKVVRSFLSRLWLLTAMLACSGLIAFAADRLVINFSRSQMEAAEARYGAPARQRLEGWMQVIAEAKGKPDHAKLQLVNDFFNQVPWISDAEHWGREDYWATPTEVLLTNGADCEDFSIAKYFTLVAVGVDMNKLRITYVKAITPNPINQAHMVLTYYPTPESIPLVLDNLIPEIQPANLRTDLIPVYSFNGDGLWLARERGEGKLAGSSSRLSLWTELNARMGKELQ